MATGDPGVPEYLTSATMWAFGVGIYHDQLREAVEAYKKAREDGAIRNHILSAPEAARYLFGEQLEKASSVMAIGTVWRMSMARYSFLAVAAQLRKCTVALEQHAVTVPQVRDRTNLRLLRDVDEHWEQIENGRSLAELRESMPDEVPTRIVFTGKYIQIGDFNTEEIADWASEVDLAVRTHLQAAGTPVAEVDESLSDFFARHPDEE